jgi:hypothetical protein
MANLHFRWTAQANYLKFVSRGRRGTSAAIIEGVAVAGIRSWDWTWLSWQVGVPLVAPILLAALFAALWWSLSADFSPNLSILIDVTPWALATYSLTLLSTTLGRFWDRLPAHKWLGAGLIVAALFDGIYYAFMVIKRHEPGFEVTSSSYYVMTVLVAAAILLCYRAR